MLTLFCWWWDFLNTHFPGFKNKRMKQCLNTEINADDFCQFLHTIYRLNISIHLTPIPLESITETTIFSVQNPTAHVIGASHIKSLEKPYGCVTRTSTTYRVTSNSSKRHNIVKVQGGRRGLWSLKNSSQGELVYVVLVFLPRLPKTPPHSYDSYNSIWQISSVTK